MGKAKIISPPPEGYVPVPLEQTHVSYDANNDGVIDEQDDILIQQMEEEKEAERLAKEEEIRKKDELAKQIHQDILKKKKVEERKAKRTQQKAEKTIVATRENVQLKRSVEKKDAELLALAEKITELESSLAETTSAQLKVVAEQEEQTKTVLHETYLKHDGAMEQMRKEMDVLRNQKIAAEKARDDTLMKYREQSVGQSQLRTKESARIAELEKQLKETEAKIQVAREEALLIFRQEQSNKRETQVRAAQDLKVQNIKMKSTWWSSFVSFIKRKKVELSMAGITNYEAAVIVRTKFAIPKMLDDIERMHEQLAILEEMIMMLEKNKSKRQKDPQSPDQ